MRWQVHGTDSASSRRVTLAVEEGSASGAVQAAMAKGILVSHVTKGPRFRVLSMALGVAVAGCLILGAGDGLLQWREGETQGQLVASQAESGRLTKALLESGVQVTSLQARTAALEQASGGAAKQLVDQMEAATAKIRSLGDELAATKAKISQLESRSADLAKQNAAIDPLKSELAQVRDESARLQQQVQAERQRAGELEKSFAATAGMRKDNQDLLAQNELLKTQLLDAVARSTAVPVAQVVEAPAPPQRPLRWSLETSYDSASDFLALHSDRDAVSTTAGGDGTAVTTGLLSANAASLKLIHDADKKRVYAAILTISLAGDAPKEKLAENQKLLLEFIRQFAPSFKSPEAWLADVAKQLANKDITDRAMRVGDDYKLTVWNNRLGLYSWKIESPRGELDD